jgi:hypothetical protein
MLSTPVFLIPNLKCVDYASCILFFFHAAIPYRQDTMYLVETRYFFLMKMTSNVPFTTA